jgi:hypothetical protein
VADVGPKTEIKTFGDDLRSPNRITRAFDARSLRLLNIAFSDFLKAADFVKPARYFGWRPIM